MYPLNTTPAGHNYQYDSYDIFYLKKVFYKPLIVVATTLRI